MKKFSSVLLILAFVLMMVPATVTGAAAQTPENPDQLHQAIPEAAETVEKDGVVYTVLRTEADLAKLTTPGGRFILASDIDFGGKAPERYTLNGTILDGNGYSYLNIKIEGTEGTSIFLNEKGEESVIRNLNIGSSAVPVTVTLNNQNDKNAGCGVIFSYTNSTFRLENINVYAVMTAAERVNMGGLIGYDNGGTATLVNCNFYGSITGNATSKADVGYAGLIGKTGGDVTLTLENCSNYGSIVTAGSGDNQKTAGLLGILQTPHCTLTNCTNFGSITTESGSSSAGFISEFYQSPKGTAEIRFTGCVNYGTVTGKGRAGGIIGYLNNGTNGQGGTVSFDRCRNYGSIVGSGSDGGGICGCVRLKSDLTVTNTANYGSLSGGGNNKAGFCGSFNMQESYPVKVDGFLNAGSVISGSRAGGFSGWLGGKDYTLNHCVNLGNMNGKGNVGGIMAMANGTVRFDNCLSAAKIESTKPEEMGVLIGASVEKASGTSNAYLKADPANIALGTEELADWAAVAAKLNKDYAALFGPFILDTEGTGVVQAAPRLSGVQDGVRTADKFSVRMIASLQDSLRYGAVGFTVAVNGGKANEISCKHVYLKLLSRENGNQTAVTAQDLGGSYVYALSIENVPAKGTVTFTVTPYAKDMEYAVNNTVYTGASYTVTYIDGVYQGAVPTEAQP